jgi:hypothetical protein
MWKNKSLLVFLEVKKLLKIDKQVWEKEMFNRNYRWVLKLLKIKIMGLYKKQYQPEYLLFKECSHIISRNQEIN